MITAPEDSSFVLGLLYLTICQALLEQGYADYSFMSATESKRSRRGVICPGANDQMDKPGLEEIKATVSGVLHPAPPLREKELKKEFHVEAAAEQEFLGSEIDFTLVCLSIKHQASSITKIYPKWESTLILRIVILAASVLCRYGFSLSNFSSSCFPELSFNAKLEVLFPVIILILSTRAQLNNSLLFYAFRVSMNPFISPHPQENIAVV